MIFLQNSRNFINQNSSTMSTQQTPPQSSSPEVLEQSLSQPQEEEMSQQEQQTYNKMMNTLSQMNSKIEKVKNKLKNEPIHQKKNKADEITHKLIQSKESSEIITKESLLTDITQSYEKVVIDVYSQNGKLKKKIQEMTNIIKEQSNKIYDHTKRERELIAENQQLRSEMAKLKDEKLILARGHVPNQNIQKDNTKQEISTKRKTNQGSPNQNQDFDFWSMPQNQYGKKKKDFVQDSNLWVNQKEVRDSVFLTQEQSTAPKKKK